MDPHHSAQSRDRPPSARRSRKDARCCSAPRRTAETVRFSYRPHSRVAAINRAAALAMTSGPERALAAMDEAAQDGELDEYYPYHAARAELLRRMARNYEAAAAYRRALALVKNATQQRFLERRLSLVE
jgi:predicted RNA polymerase sigma factor